MSRKPHKQHLQHIIDLRPSHDENARAFIPYCAFVWHKGIITTNHTICEQRRCSHYKRMYLNGDNQTPFKGGKEDGCRFPGDYVI